MKKLIALLICLSGCSPNSQVTTVKKPMIALAYAPLVAAVDNIYPVAHLYRDASVPLAQWEAYETPAVRQVEYDKLKLMPYKFLWAQGEGTLRGHPKDLCSDGVHGCPWFDAMIVDRVNYFKTLMSELKANGIKLDEFIWDNEEYWNNWEICDNGLTESEQVKAIEQDPRFISRWQDVLPLKNLSNICAFTTSSDLQIWNGFMLDWFGKYHSQIIDAVQLAQPGIEMSDFARYKYGKETPEDFNCWLPPIRATNGSVGNGWNYGSKGQYVLYGAILKPFCRDIPLGLTQDYPQDSLHALIYELNQIIAGEKAGTGKFDIVLGFKSWQQAEGVPYYYGSDAWYKESVIHSYLIGADRILYFNPNGQGGAIASDDKALSNILKEIDSYVGFSDRTGLNTEFYSWYGSTITTCAKANGKKVCRTTNADGTGVWSQSNL